MGLLLPAGAANYARPCLLTVWPEQVTNQLATDSALCRRYSDRSLAALVAKQASDDVGFGDLVSG